jgi:hypothetical protein
MRHHELMKNPALPMFEFPAACSASREALVGASFDSQTIGPD